MTNKVAAFYDLGAYITGDTFPAMRFKVSKVHSQPTTKDTTMLTEVVEVVNEVQVPSSVRVFIEDSKHRLVHDYDLDISITGYVIIDELTELWEPDEYTLYVKYNMASGETYTYFKGKFTVERGGS